jgi:NAD(P)-dependent dehydrogenase (short-subunit alcohol dehydrogenase family)
MAGQFEGKVALVTGGSAGIGRAAALLFAREGARVVVAADINVKGGEETVNAIRGEGGEAIFVRTDVSRSADVSRLVKTAVEVYGRLDCALNNAGVPQAMRTPTAELTEEDWDRVININLKGVWLCMKHEIPQMLKQGGGVIVNTSSIGGLIGLPNRAAYTASKHGIVGLTKTAALEYARNGIRVNAVCPAFTRTPVMNRIFKENPGSEAKVSSLVPFGRLEEPEEVAQAVIWLCSEKASFVTGHAMAIDGGYVAQ